MSQEIPQPVANQIYDILVEVGGANENTRDQFLALASRGISEYHFGGRFIGGKFWDYDGRWYVNYYPEHQNEKDDRIVEEINYQLAVLKQAWQDSL